MYGVNLTLKAKISLIMMLLIMVMMTTKTIIILVTPGPKRRWEDNAKMVLKVRG